MRLCPRCHGSTYDDATNDGTIYLVCSEGCGWSARTGKGPPVDAPIDRPRITREPYVSDWWGDE